MSRPPPWEPHLEAGPCDALSAPAPDHSHVALLIEQGTHPAIIVSRLGHTSVRTVLDVYGHLYEGLDRGAADALKPPWDAPDVVVSWSRRRSRGIGLEGP